MRVLALGYVGLALVLGAGVYAFAPATLFVGRDHTRPIARSYGGMHRQELYLATRERAAHRGDREWLRAHDARWAPIRQRVRGEQLAYALGWLGVTAGGLVVLAAGVSLGQRVARPLVGGGG